MRTKQLFLTAAWLAVVIEMASTFPVDAAPANEAIGYSSFSGPQALLAKKMGFRELVSYEKLGIVYPYNTVTTLRQMVSKNSELLERVLKTLIEGIAIFKTSKQKSIAVWRKYLRGASEEVMEESYQSTVGEMEQVLCHRCRSSKAAWISYLLNILKPNRPMLI